MGLLERALEGTEPGDLGRDILISFYPWLTESNVICDEARYLRDMTNMLDWGDFDVKDDCQAVGVIL